jgi:DNA-binding response OmpR family regulator
MNMETEPKKIIMMVEDDHFLSSLMKARFEKEGYTIIQAFDGAEALELLKQPPPSLIILDLIMPKVTGFEVLQTISITPGFDKVPVVILSNLAQDSDIKKAQELGAREFFVKVKISIDELTGKVKELLP